MFVMKLILDPINLKRKNNGINKSLFDSYVLLISLEKKALKFTVAIK